MGRKKAAAPPCADDPRTAVLGRFEGVPTSFFDVQVEGARYLGKVDCVHESIGDVRAALVPGLPELG